jgi:hypothetical protein
VTGQEDTSGMTGQEDTSALTIFNDTHARCKTKWRATAARCRLALAILLNPLVLSTAALEEEFSFYVPPAIHDIHPSTLNGSQAGAVVTLFGSGFSESGGGGSRMVCRLTLTCSAPTCSPPTCTPPQLPPQAPTISLFATAGEARGTTAAGLHFVTCVVPAAPCAGSAVLSLAMNGRDFLQSASDCRTRRLDGSTLAASRPSSTQSPNTTSPHTSEYIDTRSISRQARRGSDVRWSEDVDMTSQAGDRAGSIDGDRDRNRAAPEADRDRDREADADRAASIRERQDAGADGDVRRSEDVRRREDGCFLRFLLSPPPPKAPETETSIVHVHEGGGEGGRVVSGGGGAGVVVGVLAYVLVGACVTVGTVRRKAARDYLNDLASHTPQCDSRSPPPLSLSHSLTPDMDGRIASDRETERDSERQRCRVKISR